MAWDNDDRRYPGFLEDPSTLTQLLENIKQLAGTAAGQTEFVCERPVSFEDYIESTHASNFDQVREQKSGIGSITSIDRRIEYLSTNVDPTSGFPTGHPVSDAVILRAAIERIGIGSRLNMGDIRWDRVLEGLGRFKLTAKANGTDTAWISILDALDSLAQHVGFVGVNTDTPEYEFDVSSGEINVSGNFRRNGSVLNDWTNVGPGTATWAGPAVVSRQARSTVATGTAPLVSTSTTLASNMSAWKFKGYTWHPGLVFTDSATYAAADTDVAVKAVDRIGVWAVKAIFSVTCNTADDGLTVNCKVKDGAGTQLGRTVATTAKKRTAGGFDTTTVFNCVVNTKFTSATGAENIKATVAVPTGTGSLAEATLILTWQKP